MKSLFSLLITLSVFLNSLFAQADNTVCKDLSHVIQAERKAGAYKLNFRSAVETNSYDLKYHRVEWEINPANLYIKGTVTSYFVPVEENFQQMYFDLSRALNVSQVTYHGSEVSYSQPTTELLQIDLPNNIPMGQLDSISVSYSGVPDSDGFGSFVQGTHNGVPVIWTLSEPYGAKNWWPCKQDLNDKIDSIDVWVTTPTPYRVASNGVLVSETTDGSKNVYHWQHRYPIPAYLIAVGVTNYAVYSDFVPLDGGDSLEVLNYVYPEYEQAIRAATPTTVAVMQLYNELFGLYPFADEKYGHAQFGFGGGMEHQTMSFMGGWSHLLQAHELAHQWFGDKVTCGSWQDIWLNEGFATYLEGLTYENGLGSVGWHEWLRSKINSITGNNGGSVWVTDTTSVSRIFDGRLSYSKGAMLLHMLRWKLGDEDFFQAVRNYINDPELAYSYAKTQDLQAHLEAQSGLDLDGFFNDWFYGEGYPSYLVYWEPKEAQQYRVQISQTTSAPQSVDFFEMPVPVLFKGQGQQSLQVFDHQYSGQVFEIELPFVPEEVIFDPEYWLISKNNQVEAHAVTTSTNEMEELSHHLRLFPNPAKDKINLFFDNWPESPRKVELWNLQGQLIRKETPTASSLEIDLVALPAGTYVVKVYGEEGVISQHFIKTNK